MPYCLHSPLLSKIEHSVNSGAERDAGREILRNAKGTERIGLHRLHLLQLLVKDPFGV